MLHVSVFILAGLLGSCQASHKTLCSELTSLQTKLSASATIECGVQDVRWSEYAAPQPGAVITPGSEGDIATTVAFASDKNIPFLLQGGGHGWADTFSLGSSGIVIDVSGLKSITFNADRTNVTFEAGVIIGDLVSAAWENDARVMTGTCNCVGLLGATLGGGLGRTIGLYGMGADQLLAVNYVDGDGKSCTVTPEEDPDLWWALTGAGPNFGIVTSAVYRSYPVPQVNNTAWYGPLYYNDSQIEAVVSAINDLTLEPEMHLDFYYAGGTVLILPFYLGSEETGRQKFASLLALGPLADETGIVPYNSWNDGSASFCVEGGRKPAHSANLQTLEPATWRSIWNEFVTFLDEHPEANDTSILTECYSTVKAVEIGSSHSSYPWRDTKCYSMVIPWYTNSSLDNAANEFSQNVRSYWEASSGFSELNVYVNYAHGDESLSSVYGSSLPRLKTLKKIYDPQEKFNQWFPLS
ncbi:hypothetical protein VSDG_02064 [Cytospora chrysosperma]|uniref:FAD-binding PCMH-type domain-containing protein n=1 Tax=Cytospora chrysosperma TaxID=252740 RepID=A0A423WDN9_CYTCH|nr:hypothetical protein VSDG_02064 [Valsa sordida]